MANPTSLPPIARAKSKRRPAQPAYASAGPTNIDGEEDSAEGIAMATAFRTQTGYENIDYIISLGVMTNLELAANSEEHARKAAVIIALTSSDEDGRLTYHAKGDAKFLEDVWAIANTPLAKNISLVGLGRSVVHAYVGIMQFAHAACRPKAHTEEQLQGLYRICAYMSGILDALGDKSPPFEISLLTNPSHQQRNALQTMISRAVANGPTVWLRLIRTLAVGERLSPESVVGMLSDVSRSFPVSGASRPDANIEAMKIVRATVAEGFSAAASVGTATPADAIGAAALVALVDAASEAPEEVRTEVGLKVSGMVEGLLSRSAVAAASSSGKGYDVQPTGEGLLAIAPAGIKTAPSKEELLMVAPGTYQSVEVSKVRDGIARLLSRNPPALPSTYRSQ